MSSIEKGVLVPETTSSPCALIKNSAKRCFSPVLGFLVCGYIWLSLRTPAKIAGGIWLAIGIAYAAYKTGGFRKDIEFTELPPE